MSSSFGNPRPQSSKMAVGRTPVSGSRNCARTRARTKTSAAAAYRHVRARPSRARRGWLVGSLVPQSSTDAEWLEVAICDRIQLPDCCGMETPVRTWPDCNSGAEKIVLSLRCVLVTSRIALTAPVSRQYGSRTIWFYLPIVEEADCYMIQRRFRFAQTLIQTDSSRMSDCF